MASITAIPAADGEDGEHSVCITNLANAGSAATHLYYLARLTLVEMFRDRGYEVTNVEAEQHRSFADFRATFGEDPDPERLRLVASRVSDPSRAVIAVFYGPSEIKKKSMVGLLSSIMNSETLERVILVQQNKMNSHAQKVLDEYPVKVEVFQITDLVTNITKHSLMPKHVILTPEEKEKILKTYTVEGKQLPKMLADDAIAKYYGLEKGEVVKISYAGDITGTHISYRCVQ